MGRDSGSSLTQKSWSYMMTRCYNARHGSFATYGAVGISVCDGIKLGAGVLVSLIGARPEGGSLDRIDSRLNYSCGCCYACVINAVRPNIRWATRREQRLNQKRVKLLTVAGENKAAADWALLTGLKTGTIYERAKRGDTGERLLRPPDAIPKYKVGDEELTLSEISIKYGIQMNTLRMRMRAGDQPPKLFRPVWSKTNRSVGIDLPCPTPSAGGELHGD